MVRKEPAERKVAGACLQTSDSEMTHLRVSQAGLGEPCQPGEAIYLVMGSHRWSRRIMMTKTDLWLWCVGDQPSEAHLCSSTAKLKFTAQKLSTGS